MNGYASITPMLGGVVRHKKTGKRYSVSHQTTLVRDKPVVWLSAERPARRSGYRSIEQVIRDYELDAAHASLGELAQSEVKPK